MGSKPRIRGRNNLRIRESVDCDFIISSTLILLGAVEIGVETAGADTTGAFTIDAFDTDSSVFTSAIFFSVSD